MPRPAGRAATRQVLSTSPVKMQLNNDQGEKTARLQTRHALQEIHMNEVRAAASPMRKLNQTRPRYTEDSEPGTPQDENRDVRPKKTKQIVQIQQKDNLNLEEALNTPNARRQIPILANFEEWMKLATDNKINATNSWNFALIDYFHDMSLLKDGPGGQVNFQKASCTLDGCVKIYTSRVDSVATETGRLLSGLADSGNDGKKKQQEDDGEEDEEDEEGEKKKKKRPTRSHEATLAPSFASLQLKKLELEFAVDPLFKKASADFDEGGAKGLLLNHLSIDQTGRIVFDSSDDAGEMPTTEQESNEDEEQEIDLVSLATKFFPDLSALDTKDICPSMKNFEFGNPASHADILKVPEKWKERESPNHQPFHLADQTGIFLDGSNDLGFDDDDGLGFDMPDDVGFGQGGEAWAKDAVIEPMHAEDDPIEGPEDGYTLSLQHRHRDDAEQEMIHEYFDKAFNSRGKGKMAFTTSLENWRIQKIQKARQTEFAPATRQKKEKEPFFIDFQAPKSKNLEELIEALPVNNTTISLPRSQMKTKGRNILDKDDELVDVKSMMRLWTKPKCRIARRQGGMAMVDEGFGSKSRVGNTLDDDEELEPKGDYDANFFDDQPAIPYFDGALPIDDDDVVDDVGFVDAREMLSPRPEAAIPEQHQPDPPSSQILPDSFGAQLVTQAGRRMRPEYVNYARTAKKVDVRALKENMWNGMSTKLIAAFDAGIERPVTPALTNTSDDGDVDMMDVDVPSPVKKQLDPIEDTLKFTDMIGDLRDVYPESQMKDISTSYCFICLLHLANEKGLVLEGGREDGTMNEILVSKDPGVGDGYVGE